MRLKTNVENFYNDISESIRSFTDVDNIELVEENADITVTEECYEGKIVSTAEYKGEKAEYSEMLDAKDDIEEKRIKKRCAKLSVYYLMKKVFGKNLPWGSLTGIRPTKLLREYGLDKNVLTSKYDLPAKKADLLERICNNQGDFFFPKDDEIDIYIGIPFCRTRCTYCSFSSTDSTKGEKLMIPYVAALKKEIADTAKLVKNLNKKIRCVYIGGGTPTALTASLFEEMMLCANENFKPEIEFTVEAGRPDTITENKLKVMKRCGVDRISINPQSMNEATLAKIGRSHSPQEIIDCFTLAREIGFKTINTDLIAGLPEESTDMFFATLEKVLALDPENITVHTLAIKRGSKMFESGYKPTNAEDVCKMVEGAQDVLIGKNYEPYYLYRQKYMTGNFENIGYAKKGHIGVYNIDIMEETTDILALGCGGVSKRIIKNDDRIERAFNFKSIYEYYQRIDEANIRKTALFE